MRDGEGVAKCVVHEIHEMFVLTLPFGFGEGSGSVVELTPPLDVRDALF